MQTSAGGPCITNPTTTMPTSTPATSTRSHFLSLPPELRELIYGYVFIPPSTTTTSTILHERVPASSALRQTSKFINAESDGVYSRATKHYDLQRKGIQSDIIENFESFIPEGMSEEVLTPKARNIIQLARSLREPAICKHASTCAPVDDGGQCFFCSSQAHHQCLKCGKHLTIALLGNLQMMRKEPRCIIAKQPFFHALSFEAPILVLPSTAAAGEKLTDLGVVVSQLSDLPKTPLFPVGNPATMVYNFYVVLLKRQRAVEMRIWIREAAVKKFWAQNSEERGFFCESRVRAIEGKDKRMGLLRKVTRLWVMGERVDWKAEYEKRAREEASVSGTHVSLLLPA